MNFRGRDYVKIALDSSADGSLEPIYTTYLVEDLPCEIKNVAGQESFRGLQLEALVDFVVETRYRSDVTTLMQVQVTSGLYSGENLNIARVQPVQFMAGRPPMLLLLCKQVP